MSLRKPFRAIPIREGEIHRQKRVRAQHRSSLVKLAKLALIASILGGAIGYLTSNDENGDARASTLLSRFNSPLVGSSTTSTVPTYFRYCDEARAAGKAPIYRGQPGYRAGLDADGDGIACEPYP
uniref:excalibur calcium-binding domain-containing protein n=1 Tax=Altererythrobacter segetis TaxID=1104773 RepID=UPI001A9C36CB|nr:excalibur calcium-binding domain-containing protein [Altererythrobacter segetis]